MKKSISFTIVLVLLLGMLSACNSKTDQEATLQPAEATTESASIPSPETAIPAETDPTTTSVFGDTPEHIAFQKALRTIHDELYLPELWQEIDLWEPGTIEDESFAILDVDGDGKDELLVSISNTYVAGMTEVIYGYDEQTGGVLVEAQNHLAVTHYPGLLHVMASHNHGYAGDVMWPYQVSIYDEAEDVYKETYIVDAWDKTIQEYDPNRDMPYPEDVDTDHDGYVYIVKEGEQERFLNRRDFETWEAEIFAGKEPITIPWQKMTAWNIGLATPENTKIIRWGADDLLYQTDFDLNVGNPGVVRLYGKKTDEYHYGISDVVIQMHSGIVLPLDVQEGLTHHWGESGVDYTESFGADGGLILEDVNFDGYTDIGLQVQTPAYNMPYVYWYYDPNSASYCYLGNYMYSLAKDSETERCSVEYHAGQTYYKETYKAEGKLLELEERWITEYIDGKPVTRKDDQLGG